MLESEGGMEIGDPAGKMAGGDAEKRERLGDQARWRVETLKSESG